MATPGFSSLFARLRLILQQHAGESTVVDDTASSYCLEASPGPATPRAWKGRFKRTKISVAWFQIGKRYVSYHLMGLYGGKKLLDGMSKELRARLQGKNCFNFRTVDERHFLELEEVTAAGISPTSSTGSGHPRRKVNINDSDHSYFGMWNDSPQTNRNYFWINFTNGNQTLFMDPYVVYYPREKRNLCPSPRNGIGSGPDKRWENVRDTMGYIRDYADRMNLAAMTPQGKLSSTGHVLASIDVAHPEFLVYAPSGGKLTVDLTGSSGQFAVEWMNPATGVITRGTVVSGGAKATFSPPFSGDAVLYLKVKR